LPEYQAQLRLLSSQTNFYSYLNKTSLPFGWFYLFSKRDRIARLSLIELCTEGVIMSGRISRKFSSVFGNPQLTADTRRSSSGVVPQNNPQLDDSPLTNTIIIPNKYQELRNNQAAKGLTSDIARKVNNVDSCSKFMQTCTFLTAVLQADQIKFSIDETTVDKIFTQYCNLTFSPSELRLIISLCCSKTDNEFSHKLKDLVKTRFFGEFRKEFKQLEQELAVIISDMKKIGNNHQPRYTPVFAYVRELFALLDNPIPSEEGIIKLDNYQTLPSSTADKFLTKIATLNSEEKDDFICHITMITSILSRNNQLKITHYGVNQLFAHLEFTPEEITYIIASCCNTRGDKLPSFVTQSDLARLKEDIQRIRTDINNIHQRDMAHSVDDGIKDVVVTLTATESSSMEAIFVEPQITNEDINEAFLELCDDINNHFNLDNGGSDSEEEVSETKEDAELRRLKTEIIQLADAHKNQTPSSQVLRDMLTKLNGIKTLTEGYAKWYILQLDSMIEQVSALIVKSARINATPQAGMSTFATTATNETLVTGINPKIYRRLRRTADGKQLIIGIQNAILKAQQSREMLKQFIIACRYILTALYKNYPITVHGVANFLKKQCPEMSFTTEQVELIISLCCAEKPEKLYWPNRLQGMLKTVANELGEDIDGELDVNKLQVEASLNNREIETELPGERNIYMTLAGESDRNWVLATDIMDKPDIINPDKIILLRRTQHGEKTTGDIQAKLENASLNVFNNFLEVCYYLITAIHNDKTISSSQVAALLKYQCGELFSDAEVSMIISLCCPGTEKGTFTRLPRRLNDILKQASDNNDYKKLFIEGINAKLDDKDTPLENNINVYNALSGHHSSMNQIPRWKISVYGDKSFQNSQTTPLTRKEIEALLATSRDLSGQDLSLADLSRLNLVGVNMSNCNLSGCNLKKANLSGCDLSKAILTFVDMRDANLTGAKLDSANFEQAVLNGATLDNASAIGTNFKYTKLRECRLVDAVLTESDCTRANFRSVVANSANFSGVVANRANFRSVVANSANFSRIVAIGANFRDAVTDGADFSNANFKDANLENTNIRLGMLVGGIVSDGDASPR